MAFKLRNTARKREKRYKISSDYLKSNILLKTRQYLSNHLSKHQSEPDSFPAPTQTLGKWVNGAFFVMIQIWLPFSSKPQRIKVLLVSCTQLVGLEPPSATLLLQRGKLQYTCDNAQLYVVYYSQEKLRLLVVLILHQMSPSNSVVGVETWTTGLKKTNFTTLS